MRYLRFVLLAWLITAVSALIGALIGGIWDAPGRFIGATIVATLGVLLSVQMLASRGWLNGERMRGASIGGLVGLALAAPFAQMALATWVPLLAVSFVGLAMIPAAGRGAVR